MKLLDTFYQPHVIDCYTFVFDELNSSGHHTMLVMSEDGHTFSQWTSGLYDPAGENEHLGRRITLRDLGSKVLDAFFSRIAIPTESGRDEQGNIIKDGHE
jgi:hypothetical protein